MDPPGEDEQFRRAFSTLRDHTRGNIALIRDNDSSTTSLDLRHELLRPDRVIILERILTTVLAWQLLGRYIANNTHLKNVHISNLYPISLNDERMTVLFGELTSSISIERINLSKNRLNGRLTLRCMVPFLKSTRLMHIDLSWNLLGNEGFELLINTLDGKPIKELKLLSCGITDISALNTNTLSQLEELVLDINQIGNAGIMILSNMLQKEESSLTKLNLYDTGIDDEGAEFLADSLTQNTTLKHLSLDSNNGITDIGRLAFLKLVIDVSSIKNTYNSNHMLKSIGLAISEGLYRVPNEIDSLIEGVCRVNAEFGSRRFWVSSPDSCREKVIKYQLHSQRMETLCRFQGIEYSPGNIFASIEPVLLPNILDLIGNKHGQSELYTALTHTAPALLSYVDRKALIQNALAKAEANFNSLSTEYERAVTWYRYHISHLGAQKANLSSRLAHIDLGDEVEKKVQQQSLPSLVEDSSAYDFNDVKSFR